MLNQHKLAASLGMTGCNLSALEHDKYPPGKACIELLREKYNVNPIYILNGEVPIFISKKNDTRYRWREFRSKMADHNIKYLLGIRGYSISSIARDLGISRQAVHQVISGQNGSRKISAHIERLLGMKPGTLIVNKEVRKVTQRVV